MPRSLTSDALNKKIQPSGKRSSTTSKEEAGKKHSHSQSISSGTGKPRLTNMANKLSGAAGRPSDQMTIAWRNPGLAGVHDERGNITRRRTIGEALKRRDVNRRVSDNDRKEFVRRISTAAGGLSSTLDPENDEDDDIGQGSEVIAAKQLHQLESSDGPTLATHLPDIVVNHHHQFPVPNQQRMQVMACEV